MYGREVIASPLPPRAAVCSNASVVKIDSMWCSHCQQDVPGIATEDRIRCARCQQTLSSGYASSATVDEAKRGDPMEPPDEVAAGDEAQNLAIGLPSEPPPIDFDDWRLEEDLRKVNRIIRQMRAAGQSEQQPAQENAFATPIATTSHAAPAAVTPSATRNPPKRRSSFFSWALLSTGLMTFVCGGVLLGWSFAAGRGDLWSLGMPLTLAGQAGLILGLVLQLEGLWQSNRDTNKTLDELDEQLNDLRHTTTMLGTTHSSGARSFYAHLAEGANPQMLLADLKGQMDLLAQQIAQTRR